MDPTINWRRREEHPADFADVECLQVAVKLPSGRWRCDSVEVHSHSNGVHHIFHGLADWAWDWDDVDWWVPIEEIEATLPKPTGDYP